MSLPRKISARSPPPPPAPPAGLAAGTGKGALSGVTQRKCRLFAPTLQIITQMLAQLGEPGLRARTDARRKWQR